MPSTEFFRASSVEVSGGTDTTGTDNLILDGEGQFNTQIIHGDTDSDPLAVTLNFTDFFIPENNRVTGIEFIIEGQIITGNFVNVLAPTIRAGTPGNLIALPTPLDVTLVGSSGLLAGNLDTAYLPTNHTYTMDSIYAAINDPDLNETAVNSNIDNANTINQIIGDTPDRVVTLEITLDALVAGGNTLTLFGTTGASPLPAIRIFYERTTFTKVKIQAQPDTIIVIPGPDIVDPGAKTKVKLQPISIAESVIEGPNSHDVLGDVGDGLTYGAVEEDQRERLMETSTTTANTCTFTNSFPNGWKIFNFFNNNQIPLNATITGVELIAGQDFDGGTTILDNSRIATLGNSSGQIRIECRFHNGVNYSDRLSWDDSEDYAGIEFLDIEGGTSNRASFTGANRIYKNFTADDDVLFGGPNDLSGLNWDPANQANFGFSFAAIDGSGAANAGVTRGIRMKVYYQINNLTKVTIA